MTDPTKTDKTLAGISFALKIDAALLVTVIFFAGVGWMQLQSVRADIAAVQSQIRSMESIQPANAERLARIEQGVIDMQDAVREIKSDIRDRRKP